VGRGIKVLAQVQLVFGAKGVSFLQPYQREWAMSGSHSAPKSIKRAPRARDFSPIRKYREKSIRDSGVSATEAGSALAAAHIVVEVQAGERGFCGKWCRRAAPKVNWLLFDKGTPLELT